MSQTKLNSNDFILYHQISGLSVWYPAVKCPQNPRLSVRRTVYGGGRFCHWRVDMSSYMNGFAPHDHPHMCTGVGGFVIGEPRANREDESEGTLSELLVSGHDNAATSSCLGSILFTIVFTAGDDKIHLFIKTDKDRSF